MRSRRGPTNQPLLPSSVRMPPSKKRRLHSAVPLLLFSFTVTSSHWSITSASASTSDWCFIPPSTARRFIMSPGAEEGRYSYVPTATPLPASPSCSRAGTPLSSAAPWEGIPTGDNSMATHIRQALSQGLLEEALRGITELRRIAPVPPSVYEQLIRRCYEGKRSSISLSSQGGPRSRKEGVRTSSSVEARKQVALEAFKMYWSDAVEGQGLPPAHQIVYKLLELASKGGDWSTCLYLIELLIRHLPDGVNEYSFFLVFKCLAATNKMSRAEDLLGKMHYLNILPSRHIYAVLFKGYGRQAWERKVDSVRDHMDGQGVIPDLVVANSLVDAYTRCGNMNKAMQVLDLMLAGGLNTGDDGLSVWPRPDAYTFNTILRASVATGAVDQAMRALKRMEEVGVVPDEVTINTLTTVFVKAGQLDRALELVHEKRAGVEGYTAIVDGFAKKGDYQGATEVMRIMKGKGVEPNVYTYTSLMTAAAGKMDSQTVERIFTLLKLQGQVQPLLRPTVRTYNTVIALFTRCGNTPRALGLLEEMKNEAGLKPDVVTCNTLIGGLLTDTPPRMAEAERVFLDMVQKGPEPDRYTYATMLAGYPEGLGGPQRVYEMMRQSKDLTVDTVVVNALLDACIKCQRLTTALEFFDDFKKGLVTGKGGRPDVVSYTTLIHGVAASDNVFAGRKIMQLYREMRKKFEIPPDMAVIRAIIQSLGRARSRVGGIEMADLKEILQDLWHCGWPEEQITYVCQQISAVSAAYTEAWKESFPGGARSRWEEEVEVVQESVTDKVWRRHGWNSFNSGFRHL